MPNSIKNHKICNKLCQTHLPIKPVTARSIRGQTALKPLEFLARVVFGAPF